jgi:hypothetical protein
MKFLRDSQQAFRDALGNGDLNMETVGAFMYMYSEADGDWFKNRNTREYVKFVGQILTPESERIYIKA